MKKNIIIMFCFASSLVFAQTKKYTKPKPKSTNTITYTTTPIKTEDRTVAINKAKQDSIVAVNAVIAVLAKQEARRMFLEDSAKKAQLTQQKVAASKSMQEKYDAMHSDKNDSEESSNSNNGSIGLSQPIQIGGGFGIGSMLTSGLGIGTGISFHAKYFIKNNIAVGIEYSNFGATVNNTEGQVKEFVAPLLLTGDYYLNGLKLSDTKITPYAGLGVGMVRLGIKEASVFGGGSLSASYLGVQPRFGVQYALTENFMFDANVSYSKAFASSEVSDGTGFLGLRLSIAYRFMAN